MRASVRLTWSPPSITGDRTDLKYVVTYVKGAGAGSSMFTVETTYTNITLNDLEFSTLYHITVEAMNGVSMGLGSSINRTVTISVTTLGQRELSVLFFLSSFSSVLFTSSFSLCCLLHPPFLVLLLLLLSFSYVSSLSSFSSTSMPFFLLLVCFHLFHQDTFVPCYLFPEFLQFLYVIDCSFNSVVCSL